MKFVPKLFVGFLVFAFLFSMVIVPSFHGIGTLNFSSSVKASSSVNEALAKSPIMVPGAYSTIQQAVDAASAGDTIYVGAGIYNESVTIVKENMTLVGAGSSSTIINGKGANGFYVNSNGVSISGFNFTSCIIGIYINEASNCSVSNNYLTANKFGIWFNQVTNSSMDSNTAVDNEYDIRLSDSPHNVLTNNVMKGGVGFYNFAMLGTTLDSFVQRIDKSNTINGKTLYYFLTVQDQVFNPVNYPNIGGIVVVNSSRVTVRDLMLSNNFDGILFAYVRDSTVQNVSVSENKIGVDFVNSVNCTVKNSVIFNDWFYGIALQGSSGCVAYANNVSNDFYGIFISGSNSSNINNNVVAGNQFYGLHLDYAFNNLVFHNNIVNNSVGQLEFFNSTNNQFDNGVEGNYWSNYVGSDTDNDGIGDSGLPFEQFDNHPLVGNYSEYNLLKGQDAYTVESITNSLIYGLKFNQTENTLTFNISFTSSKAVMNAFCRLLVPNELLAGPYTVLVNDFPPEIINQKSIGNQTMVYFEFSEGTKQITLLEENATFLKAIAGSDQNVQAGATVYFNASRSYGNLMIASYNWDFGDGANSSGVTVTHIFQQEGKFNVTLTLEDVAGNIATDSIVVTVQKTLTPTITPTSSPASVLTASLNWWVSATIILNAVGALTIGIFVFRRKKEKVD